MALIRFYRFRVRPVKNVFQAKMGRVGRLGVFIVKIIDFSVGRPYFEQPLEEERDSISGQRT
jgi:hypothetical protein